MPLSAQLDAQSQVGHVKEGLVLLDEALAVVNETGGRVAEAELHRLKGDLLLPSGVQSLKSRVQEAEACFQKAIDVARSQSTKSLELRAAMSLSRLWQRQDKRDEARKLLAEIYGWFTEGFDTADLKDAKTLLD
jgi:predicted ATPase